MAHNLNFNNGQHSFASKKKLAWHGLGQVVEAMTSREAIELGGLNYEVGLAELSASVQALEMKETFEVDNVIRTGRGEQAAFNEVVPVPGNFATYRKDNNDVFGVVGSRYEIIQNTEAFDFMDSLVQDQALEYETVGALGKGEKVFLTAKLPNKLIVNKEDIDKYLLLTMAHDGSGAIQVLFTPIRVVCNNTLTAAISNGKNRVSIRHTKNAREKLELSKKILGIVDIQSGQLQDAFTSMSKLRLHDDEIESLILKAFNFTKDEKGKISTRAVNIVESVLEYHEVGVGQENIKGTAWGAYNAITGYQQNVQSYRSLESQFESINDKTAAKIRQTSFNEILKML